MVKLKLILSKLRLRDIKENWKNYLSVIIIAFLSIALCTGLYQNYLELNSRIDEVYEKSNMGGLFITTSGYENEASYNKDLEYIKEYDSNVTSRFYTQIQYDELSLLLISYNNKNYSNYYELREGEEGILLDYSFAKKNNVKVGDTITISFDFSIDNSVKNLLSNSFIGSGNNFIKEEKMILSLMVDGLITHPESINKATQSSGLIYMNESTLRESLLTSIKENYNTTGFIGSLLDAIIENAPLFNQFVINDDTKKEEIESYFKAKLDNNLLLLSSRENLPTNQALESDRTQALMLLFVFPTVFYLVGVLIIITTIRDMASKNRMSMATMSSLGMSKREIITHFALLSVIITLIGGLLGAIVGPILIPRIMDFKNNLIYELPKSSLVSINMLSLYSSLVLVGIALLVSFFETIKIVKHNTNDMFRGTNISTYKKLQFEKISFFNKKTPLFLKMSLRNIKKNISRTIMVILGVLGCAALLATGFGIDDTINNGLDSEEEKLYYDLSFNVSDLSIKDKLDNLDIKYDIFAEYGTTIYYKDSSYDTKIYILNENQNVTNIKFENNGATIDTKVAKKLNLSVGDTVTYKIGAKYYEIKIGYIEELFISHAIFIPSLLSEEEVTPNRCYVKYLGADQENTIKELNGIRMVLNRNDYLETVDSYLSGIRLITLTIKIFAILLAVVVIYNLALLNFKERSRDIATLKVLGFNTLSISKMLLTEILILTCIASILGELCAMPLLKLLLGINQIELVEYLYKINISSYIISFSLTFFVSLVINIVICLFTKKIKMVESLKSIE